MPNFIKGMGFRNLKAFNEALLAKLGSCGEAYGCKRSTQRRA